MESGRFSCPIYALQGNYNYSTRRKAMDAYTEFAKVYDLFMDNIDYPAWCTYLTGILKEYGIE